MRRRDHQPEQAVPEVDEAFALVFRRSGIPRRLHDDERVQDDLANDPKLATNNQRIEARPWLVPKVAAVFKTYTKDALEQL